MNIMTIRLPDDVCSRLIDLSTATGRSKSYYIREALVEYLEDMEDIYMADQRREELETKKSHTIPFDEIVKEYEKPGRKKR
jgi:RHH-type rel operon transcriptional repressor/antitoxin RelB